MPSAKLNIAKGTMQGITVTLLKRAKLYSFTSKQVAAYALKYVALAVDGTGVLAGERLEARKSCLENRSTLRVTF